MRGCGSRPNLTVHYSSCISACLPERLWVDVSMCSACRTVKAYVLNMCSMQSNALQAENAILRGQIQEHQAHAAALQDQSAEQSRTISLGSLQLKQLQSKVRQICICGFLLYTMSTYTAMCLLGTHGPSPQKCHVASHR